MKNETITRQRTTTGSLCVREAGEGEKPSRTITGYAILFNTPSDPLWSEDGEEAREVIAPEAITRETLDGCDIKMTMFHDRQLILARSKNGAGTLRYDVDDKGVSFEFEAPNTADGDKALELVRRGDIAGCSFAFSTYYYDTAYVSRDSVKEGGMTRHTYTVRAVTGIYDFTLAADPAYPDTSCATREFFTGAETAQPEEKPTVNLDTVREQVSEMRRAAAAPII